MNETKPCPFCGSSEVFYKHQQLNLVECDCCGASMHIADWNRRPTEDALRAELACRDEIIQKLKEENEQLIRSFCEYETICADGEVGASVVNMKKRIDELEIELACRDDTIKKLSEKLYDEMSQLEIATDLGNRRWIALNEIYNNGEKHNTNWCKRKAQEGLGLK